MNLLRKAEAEIILKILLAAAAFLCFAGCKEKPRAAPPPPIVEVTAVTQADVPIYHEWVGTLDGLVNATIRAQVTGYLLSQDYREGDAIKKGDLLFQIDPRPFQAVLDQANGQLAQAEARQGKTELDVKRYAPLVKDRAISQEEYDDAVQANLEAKAAVLSAKAQVEQAQLNLGFTKIVSPIDGIASIAKGQIGDLVGPTTGELTTVSTIDPIKAYYNVTEQAYINFAKLFSNESDRAGRLRQLEIQLILSDGTVYPQIGRIYTPDREIGPTTGALRLEARFPNPDGTLRPGEFVRVQVKFDVNHGALLVPQRAVSELQGAYQVNVVDADNKVHIQPVRVGERSGSLWIIEQGLAPGQRVVVEGLQRIRDGVTVTTTNYVPAASLSAEGSQSHLVALPIAQFPKVVPPEIFIQADYVGADAQTIEQAVATPIEQQMSGVDNMNYMYSVNANNGLMRLFVNFDLATDPNIDQVLTQLRYAQAQSQLPADVQNYGVTVQKSLSAPFMILSLNSPKGSRGAEFLANYAYINLSDPLSRVVGVSSVTVFGAGQYAMRIWVKPDQLAKLNITVAEIINAVKSQNAVNPAGKIGGRPTPPGQEFTYTVLAQGRLTTEEQFGSIVLRATPDGAVVRLRDVARIELSAADYDVVGRFDGKPSAILALFQLPNSNAIDAAKGVKKLMEELKSRFPSDIDYEIPIDTTKSVTEGIREIGKTFWEALGLVMLVVFIFLQGWRAALIPLAAVPVSLIGTFALFPLLGFSINTLSLFGLVLAIGLVVDDAIVVVEAVEHHIGEGMSPKDATLKAMEEVAGPVVAIALILSAVFLPTVFIPGITGRLYQQFAVTIAISVLISAFNALTLSPALSALLLRPKQETKGPLGWFFNLFNRGYNRLTDGYVGICRSLIRKSTFSLLFLGLVALGAAGFGAKIPSGFLPEEDQGYLYINVQLPFASSMDRTLGVCKQVEDIALSTPGVESCTTVGGFTLLSFTRNTYSATFWVSLKDWAKRTKPEESYPAIKANLGRRLSRIPAAIAFAFPPPAIAGVGTAGGFTMVLEDRSGKDISFLAGNVTKFMDAVRKRPEIASISTTFLPAVPQLYVDVDRDRVFKQGVDLAEVYKTLQTFMGGYFVNYFNRFGRQWQVYVEAEGEYRTRAENLGLFYVRNHDGESIPMSALTSAKSISGPEFTMRYNLYRSAQLNGTAAPGYSSAQATKALEEVFAQAMPPEMGYDYIGMSFQEQKAAQGVSPAAIFALSFLFVFLILAALYESWSLPFSVLLGTPIAVFGAFAALLSRQMVNNVFAQIGLVMLIGLAAKNAILIVEFARLEYEKGKPLIEATLTGARLRLRPILMTSFAFILGSMPLWFATGAGAVSRRILGTVVIGGMLAATCVAVCLIPVTFYVVEKLASRRRPEPKPTVSLTEPAAGELGS
jgi:hydrophobic/amphiphilic exporter-1 (mainly G- bacteria), HAE1 family